MKNFVCWREEMVEKVMDTEALHPSRAVFLATHHPIRMYRASNVRHGAPIAYEERRFLDDLLKPSGYAFAAILGESGTGKSHLIRWLDLNIPRQEGRRVLLIPKVGTNLKSIIRQILEGMVGPRFDEYRRRLDESTQDVTEAAARLRFLSNLAIAVGESETRDSQLSTRDQYFAKHLPDFLLDPVFRPQWVRDGGRIHELVTHVLGRGERVERVDKPREFSIDDLPLEGVAELANASAAARGIHASLLGNEEMAKDAVAWLNQHISVSIRELLNMGGENLLELMLDVREALGDQGTELVLLIEDFAKLQGIDRQLLEALLLRENHSGRRPLCGLRTALAVTKGYFERLEDTVKSRVTFRVEMDVTTADMDGLVTDDDIEEFTSRYLNAIRLTSRRLDQWVLQRDQFPEEPVPNGCDGCQHKLTCHASFGERDGVGLYPFNSTAVARAAKRVSDAGRFNPRVLINRVMKETFEKYSDDIRKGSFPPPTLQQQFGRSQLPALVKSELRQRDPQNWERRQVLLDLWTSGMSVVNLPLGVHEAFALPPLIDAGVVVNRRSGAAAETAPERPVVDQLPERTAQFLRDLDDWQNGQVQEPKQVTTNALRPLVFRAVVEHIDWDAELLLKSEFAGGGGRIFQQRYIDFSNSEERLRTGNFKLTIPTAGGSLNDAALALQGLLQYEHHGNWLFANGPALRRAYLSQLEQWSAAVLHEIRRPTQSGTEWDPVPALVEVLAVGARLHGLPARANPEVSDYVDALFVEWERVDNDLRRSPEWRELAKALYLKRKDLVRHLLSRIPCTKGAGKKIQIIDAAQIVRPLRRVRSEWQLEAEVPDDASREFSYVNDIRGRLIASLHGAVAAERARIEEWQEATSDVLSDATREDVISALRELAAAASGAGLSPPVRDLDTAIDGFPSKNSLKAVRETMGRLRVADNVADQMAEVSRPISAQMTAIETLAVAANHYLAAVEARINSKQQELESAGGEMLDAAAVQLEMTIEGLEDVLTGGKEVGHAD